jgi:hypothetical protein
MSMLLARRTRSFVFILGALLSSEIINPLFQLLFKQSFLESKSQLKLLHRSKCPTSAVEARAHLQEDWREEPKDPPHEGLLLALLLDSTGGGQQGGARGTERRPRKVQATDHVRLSSLVRWQHGETLACSQVKGCSQCWRYQPQTRTSSMCKRWRCPSRRAMQVWELRFDCFSGVQCYRRETLPTPVP